MGKRTSYHPIRGPRQSRMPEGAKPVPAGKPMGMQMRGVGFSESLDRTQPRDRSAGVKRVKTRMAEKGI